MELTTLLTTLLTTFSTTPNLCDDVYLDPTGAPYTDLVGQTLSRYCEWTGPDAPVWDADVCCAIDEDGARCSATDANGRCRTGLKMYCEYGETTLDDGVVCYQPFPSACDRGLCVESPDVPPVAQMAQEFLVCCSSGGACQFVNADDVFDCEGELLYCQYGFDNGDDTVTCID